jgi:hypothetical protein
MKKMNGKKQTKADPPKPATWVGDWHLDKYGNVFFSPTVESDAEYQELRKRVGQRDVAIKEMATVKDSK